MGKILRVNLKSNIITQEKIGEDVARKYIGGRALGAKILFDELNQGIDPLGHKNKLVFATGPLTGAPFAGNNKFVIMAKSPLTRIWGEAHASGRFGCLLKYAGYDALVVEEISEKPVYIWINENYVEIKNANNLWGKTTGRTTQAIRKEINESKASVATIGIGGENLVKFACVITDFYAAAGRCGMGAVMGSKKLKAIAVYGTRRVEIANEDEFKKMALKATREAKGLLPKVSHPEYALPKGLTYYAKYGTPGNVQGLNASGRLPTKAFRRCVFDGSDRIDGEALYDTILVKRVTCPGCPVACNRVVKASKPYHVDPSYGGPEYETIAAFGSLCMNDNLVSIAKANELCNKHSIDTISTGVAIAFAMECYEHGLLSKKETDDMDLSWGNHKAIVKLTEKIAKREGMGNLLAEGVKIASEKIGRGSEKFALHVKGLELPMHEPRGKKGLGLTYAVSNRGACHLQGLHDDDFELANVAPEIGISKPVDKLDTSKNKVVLVKKGEEILAVEDSLVVCMHLYWPGQAVSVRTLYGIITAITGWDISYNELMTIGERAINLCRAFNVREGIARKDDVLPERIAEPLPEGLYKGVSISKEDLEKMLSYYYEMRGWNQKGVPTREKLGKLGLQHVADEMKKLL